MVFGLLFDPQSKSNKKLEQERQSQQALIEAQLATLNLEHGLQSHTLQQKGLIQKQQRQKMLEEKEKEERAKREKQEQLQQQQQPQQQKVESKENGNASSSTTTTQRTNGSNHNHNHNHNHNQNKLAQHVDMARKGYEQLVHAIIRPPRANYQKHHLGPSKFQFLGQDFERIDSEILTERGLQLQVSEWMHTPSLVQQKVDSLIIYLHGNASARVEVLQQLSYILSLGVSGVVALDFAGSGLSDGDYVSLGYWEREDLQSVIAWLRSKYGSSVSIGLWGRSMGAATALMYASREATWQIQNVKCLLLDSSFCDLVQLAGELVQRARDQGITVPNVVVSVALAAIGWSVQQKAQFDIQDISPMQHASKIAIPALFVCGEQDDFIPPHHSEKLMEAYQGMHKSLLKVQGDHNDMRPLILFQAACDFWTRHLLQNDSSRHLVVPAGLDLQTAPWQHRGNADVYRSIHEKDTCVTIPTVSKASSTVSEVDPNDLGMTKARQEAIQSSLQTMFGKDCGDNGDDDEAALRAAANVQSPKEHS